MTADVIFYFGTGPVRLLVRALTRRGKSFRDTPSHCGISVNGLYYEAILAGVHCIPCWPKNVRTRVVSVPLTSWIKTASFLHDQLGKPYDEYALFLDISSLVFRKLKFRDADTGRWDCSRLVLQAVAEGGFVVPDLTCPPTPEMDESCLCPDAPPR